MPDHKSPPDAARADAAVAQARVARDARQRGYREQALKLFPWVCGRCGREFTHANLHELTVHHRDHDHEHNPPDGSNWELLCLYCHDNEHRRRLEAAHPGAGGPRHAEAATGRPFSDLRAMLEKKKP